MLNCSRCGILFDSDTPHSFRVNKYGYDMCDDCFVDFKEWIKKKPVRDEKKKKDKDSFSMVTKGYDDMLEPLDLPNERTADMFTNIDFGLGEKPKKEDKEKDKEKDKK